MARSKLSRIERLECKISPEPNTGCWLWLGYCEQGYGRLSSNAAIDGDRQVHRVTYRLLRGEIPEGLELDHLCRVRCCVNPDHLEPVTKQVNIQRGLAGKRGGERMRARTHCPQGHPYSDENTQVRRGKRECITCVKDRSAAAWVAEKQRLTPERREVIRIRHREWSRRIKRERERTDPISASSSVAAPIRG